MTSYEAQRHYKSYEWIIAKPGIFITSNWSLFSFFSEHQRITTTSGLSLYSLLSAYISSQRPGNFISKRKKIFTNQAHHGIPWKPLNRRARPTRPSQSRRPSRGPPRNHVHLPRRSNSKCNRPLNDDKHRKHERRRPPNHARSWIETPHPPPLQLPARPARRRRSCFPKFRVNELLLYHPCKWAKLHHWN
jgi:hypothetical protein